MTSYFFLYRFCGFWNGIIDFLNKKKQQKQCIFKFYCVLTRILWIENLKIFMKIWKFSWKYENLKVYNPTNAQREKCVSRTLQNTSERVRERFSRQYTAFANAIFRERSTIFSRTLHERKRPGWRTLVLVRERSGTLNERKRRDPKVTNKIN